MLLTPSIYAFQLDFIYYKKILIDAICILKNKELSLCNFVLCVLQSPVQSPSPVMCQSPEYLYSPYPGEYVGVPLEPPGPIAVDDEPEDDGPSTAEIIASQSQDYVDEKLAEYQATIQQLQGKCNTQILLLTRNS